MPRFFFNYVDGVVIQDDTGMVFPDITEAQKHARIVASELSRNAKGTKALEIIVADEAGHAVAKVTCCG